MLFMFAYRFCQIDYYTIDTLTVSLQEHLLMPTDDSELEWLVLKLL